MTKKNPDKTLIDTIVDGIDDVKGEDITILDLKEIENSPCDYFIICNGNSNTQVAAIASSVERRVRNDLKERPIQVEGTDNAQWILMDYVSIVVHVFQKRFRDFYNIEDMWGDAIVTNISKEI